MVRTCTGDFTQDVPKVLNAHAGAATNELHNATCRTPPPPPPPPMNLEQREVHPPHRQPGVETSYTNFLVMHHLMFVEATNPLEANNWLCIIESKFRLLHCIAFQKTLFVAQQILGLMSAWWANFTATI
jgi:hypothetical protein